MKHERKRVIHEKPLDMGFETKVFSHEVVIKNDQGVVSAEPGKTVLKNYAFDNYRFGMEGFDEKLKTELAEHYEALCKQYGKGLFPQQRFLKLPAASGNPQAADYLLVQERITPARRPDLFDYSPRQLPATARLEAVALLAARKDSYRRFLADPEDRTNRHLDLFGVRNLIVTADGHIKFVDTSPKNGFYNRIIHPIPFVLGTTAMLEAILRKDPQAMLRDPFYHDLITHPGFIEALDVVDNPKVFRSTLRYLAWSDELIDKPKDDVTK